MGRQGLMDDSGYHGFDECARYEECTNDIIEHLLEPYNVESIEELINKAKAEERKHIIDILFGIDRQVAELVEEILDEESNEN